MKTILFIFAMMMPFSYASAQKTNLIFFSEGGEKFYVILNSVLQNEKPETNVKVTDLVAPNYKLKILFKDSTIAPVEKSLMFSQGTETTFNIKKNNKGDYVVRYLNEVPIAQSVPPSAGQSIVVFSASGPSIPAPVTTTTISTTHTATTTGNTNAPVEGGSIGINMGGVNLNMNMNVPGTNMPGASSSTTYSTTTTTTTTSTGGNVVHQNPVPPPPPPQQQQPDILAVYSGPVGCPRPMSPGDFTAMKSTISSKSFEDSKLTIAKQSIAVNCLLASQVKEIMMLFSFEDSKLEFAKYAYAFTYDKGNYFKVNDAFTFDASTQELNTYITGK